MRLPARGRTVVRCPNQHEFETDMLDPEQLAIQRLVCELCGAKFSPEMPSHSAPPRVRSGKPTCMENSAEKE